jgi:hypothetical protein
MRPPEPLGPQHQLEGFDCGNAALNRWLQQRALANERQGVSRTVVLCRDEGMSRVNPLGRLASIKLAGEVPQVVAGDNLGAATRKLSHPATRSLIGTGFS